MEHLLDICCYCDWFLPEPDQDTQEAVVQVWTYEDAVERKTLVLCTGVKNNSNLVRFSQMVDSKSRQVPTLLTLSSSRCRLSMIVIKYPLNEVDELLFHYWLLLQCASQ